MADPEPEQFIDLDGTIGVCFFTTIGTPLERQVFEAVVSCYRKPPGMDRAEWREHLRGLRR